MSTLVECLGWYGTLAIICAYALVSFDILIPGSFLYQFLNASGAIGIVLVSVHKRDYQPAILNMVWTAVAVIAILRLFLLA